ncbi:MAG: ribosomal RNA small subunit methyltransferase A [Acidobacteria bacterium]|nr:ribosomal RNA small subunit methyltransferase A [Acidobacteriota bacterium]
MSIHRRPPLGQVFLQDRRVADRILQSLQLQPGDAVLEIGPGPGNMTERLATTGAAVRAVEIDPKLAEGLRKRFAENHQVEIVEADILRIPIDELARSLGRERIKVFGNLPYYITSPCLLHLFHFHGWIEEIVVMVQREVAQRMVAAPGSSDYGLFSVTCQYYARPKLLFTVPPRAFRPEPQVHSAVVRMPVASQKEPLGIGDEEDFWRWMRAAFAQKRKTLINNWKQRCEPERLKSAMEELGLDQRARAESLSLAQLAALHKASSPSG